jgi:transcriptional regulatory protein RtcR
MDFQLALAAQELGKQVRFTTEARTAYLLFATATDACWRGNFRDLSASITRLATLADHGRIGISLVQAEIQRLHWQWQSQPKLEITDAIGVLTGQRQAIPSLEEILGANATTLDKFDQLQLQAVIAVCRRHRSISDAGRELFNMSRQHRSVINDADRLRKYLLKFGLEWDAVQR